MTRILHWMHSSGRIEVRMGGTPPIERLAVSDKPRLGTGSLLQSASLTGPGDGLPAWVLPQIDMAGHPVDLKPLINALEPRAHIKSIELVLPVGHPRIAASLRSHQTPELISALWVQHLEEPQAEELHARARLVRGLLIQKDETVISAGSDIETSPGTKYLHRLPRILFEDHALIADNTDAAVSMGRLLEEFVQRFSSPERALPHVRVATGYLYHHGLRRVLRLLENERLETLRVLFSGKTDVRTARAITSQLAQEIVEDVENSPSDETWNLYRRALEEGRLEFRVYTDAFLHAKLFLGWEFENRHNVLEGSYAVVGSSNLSSSGLQANGNLELDVTLRDAETNTRLKRWFEGRWEEASPPVPTLLEILDAHRPEPPPSFQIDGLFEVWRAGVDGRLAEPASHLALLAHLYGKRLKRIEMPTEAAFPPDSTRAISPTHEQEEGVLALVQRLQQARVAFLADSVGLGKTVTALGTVWYLRRHGLANHPILISPRKLFSQWHGDAARLHSPTGLLRFINRHELERMPEKDALQSLEGVDLILVEEAHEPLRTRTNKLWTHLRAYLKANQGCRLLLISATPWNNRREDIFNYLLLAWNEGRLLQERYPALDTYPLKAYLSGFMVGIAGLTASGAVRRFDQLPVATYRRVFDQAFVQRTRSGLVRRYGTVLDYPERRVHPHTTPVSEPHDALFSSLAGTLTEFSIPYREPFRAFLRAAAEVAPSPDGEEVESNLQRSFLIQLYKRAESSEFSLAVSLAGIERQLLAFDAELAQLIKAKSPKKALREWLDQRYLRMEEGRAPELFPVEFEGDAEGEAASPDAELLSPAEKVRFANVRGLLDRLDDRQAKALLKQVSSVQVSGDLSRIRALRAQLTLELDERSPKALLLSRITREAYVAGYKPILVAGYADTVLRFFLRLLKLLPDASIGLALGGDEAWLYRPSRNRSTDLTQAEWTQALSLPPEERRTALLAKPGRAQRIPRVDLLGAFSPRALRSSPELFQQWGEVDVLVGSEAISVGHNLQDSTCLVQLDLPWNPMVIEQRIGRIDRRGGGRVDPQTPGGRRIVDIHYCWSNAAIEKEVALRQRLKEKAGQAILDTNFDEILLHEVVEEIQRARAERKDSTKDEQARLAAFLASRQLTLAESRTQVGGIPPGSGSELDGLRQLGAWAKEHSGQRPPEPVVAAGCRSGEISQESFRWLLSLALQPLDAEGKPLVQDPLHVQLPLGALTEELSRTEVQPDLEALVGALLRCGDPLPRPSGSRAVWTRELRALDELLTAFRSRLLVAHNTEVHERLKAQLAPAAKRDPSTQLRTMLVQARDALAAELQKMAQTPGAQEVIAQHQEKLAFLMQQALRPERAVDLLASQEEAPLLRTLALIKNLPDRFLTLEFEVQFDQLCGALWASSRSGGSTAPVSTPSSPELPTLDGHWADLRLRVLAATFAEG